MTYEIDWDRRQDVIEWLEEHRDSPAPELNPERARVALDLIDRYDRRESVAISMLTVGRPHTEIRAFLLTGEAPSR